MNLTDRVSRLAGGSSRPRGRRARRALALAATVSLATLTAAACSSSSSPASSSSASGGASASSSGTSSANQASVSGVTLRVGDQAGTGAQALLTAAGLIGKLPFKVAWSDFTSGPPMLQAMGAGAVDVGGVGNAAPVFAAAGGDKIAIVGAYQANPLGSALLVPKNSVMLKAANDDASSAVPITPAVISSEQQVSDAFTSAGLIPVHVNFHDYVDTTFNNTASATS